MRNIAALALNDLRLTFKDRGAVLWMFVLPVVFAAFFGMVIGGGSSSGDVSADLTVVDLDGSLVSQMFVKSLASEGISVSLLTPQERSTKEDLVRTLVIPEGFGEGVREGSRQTLRLEKEPGTSAEAALVVQARIISATARLLGRLVEAEREVGVDTPISAEAFAADEAPLDLVTVDTRIAGRATVVPDGFAQSIPGMTVMFVMLVALTYGAASVSSERASGKLRRLVTAPVARPEVVGGKIAGRFVIAALQITVLVSVGVVASRVFGLYIGDHPLQMWLVLLVFALAVAPLGVAFGGWFTDPDRAASVGVLATMTMAALGGCWWPLEVVSPTLQRVALVFPTGWAMQALHGIISFGKDLGGVVPSLLALAAFAAAFSLLAARSLRVD
ncbi:MAG: ABC transporter permease [Acidobacteriota bacterium]